MSELPKPSAQRDFDVVPSIAVERESKSAFETAFNGPLNAFDGVVFLRERFSNIAFFAVFAILAGSAIVYPITGRIFYVLVVVVACLLGALFTMWSAVDEAHDRAKSD